MESLELLWGGLDAALTPTNLMYAAIGVLLGTFVGVLPGIGPAMAVALLLPVTFGLEPTQAFIMFAGIYYGGMYGGSTTSILLNTPGESASVMTAIEGNKMAKRGRAAQALATAAIGSFIAGTIGTLLVVFFAPALADVAVEIGAASYLAITLMAMVLVTSVLGSSRLRGFISLFLGLTIGLVGLDLNTGQARLSFDQPQLADRLDIVVVAVGIFALGEALWVAAHLRRRPLEIIPVGQPFMGRQDWARSWKPWLRGTALGFPFGAVPAAEPRPRRSCPTCWSVASPASTAVSSGTAPSRASPVRRPPTTHPRPARSCPCWRWACPSRRRRRSCSPPSRATASSRDPS